LLFGSGQALAQKAESNRNQKGTAAVGVVSSDDLNTEKGSLPLYGFGGSLSFYDSSGITGPNGDSYENSVAFYIEPIWHVGKLFWKNTFFEKMSIGARLLVSTEITGNEAGYRGQQFNSPQLFDAGVPGAILVNQNATASSVPGQQISGTGRIWTTSDLWLNVDHPQLYTIPVVDVKIGGNLRGIFPTSLLSRDVGLQGGISPAVSFGRSFFKKRLTVGYTFRFIKYFFENTTQNYNAINQPVVVNGQQVTPYQPSTTGVLNPEWAVWHALNAKVQITKKLDISATYLFISNFTYPNSTNCTVQGVPGANLCTDGQAVGDVIGPGQRAQRDAQWFLGSINYDFLDWLSAGIGISTYQPLRKEGLGIANPFLRTVATANLTTIFAGGTFTFEKFYTHVIKRSAN
jgi:hypothetical protein